MLRRYAASLYFFSASLHLARVSVAIRFAVFEKKKNSVSLAFEKSFQFIIIV